MVSQNPIDPNNLLEQEQPRRLSRRTITLGLVAMSLAFFFVPLYFVLTAIRSDAARLEANIQAAQESLANPSTPVPENQDLIDELARVQGLASQIEGAHSNIKVSHTNWPAIMAAIGNYDPAQISLTSLTQADSRITLNGRATDDTVVVAYAGDLEESGLFSRVVVQSLKTIASPSATATLTSTAGTPMATPITPTTTVTPAVTPTPGARDEYEVDDFEPKVIFLGQPQMHNFYPVYDVDKAKFLAKAGRYYRVFTSDLAIGVDTFLAVSLGSIRYTNDDYQPGVLNSELVFQVGSSDANAVVRVTNRGQYGPDRWYQITVEEVIPTPTPTFTPVPTPTLTSVPSPTPIPTDTPTPVPTLTPTPDLRDEYEPDEDNPRQIGLDQTQSHNFYPENDVDKVRFQAQGGQWYRVSTSHLALGVDTVIEIEMDDGTFIDRNDDIGPNGICFPAPSTGTVVVIVTNFEKQYGPDKTYDITLDAITVNDVPILNVSPLNLDFAAVKGEPTPTPPAREVNIANFRPCDLNWMATKGAGADWLSIAPSSGVAPAVMNVSVNATGLPEGTYEGSIIIHGTSLCTQNTPLTVTVTLQVMASTASSRLPGVAALIPGLALARPAYSLPMMAGQALPSSSLASRGLLSTEAVEFVIVLELK